MNVVSGYICACLECVAVLVVMAGVEKERRNTSIAKMVLMVLVYMAYYAMARGLNLPPESAYVGYLFLFVYLKLVYFEKTSYTILVLITSVITAFAAEFVTLCGIFALLPKLGQIEVWASGITVIVSVFIYRSRLCRFVEYLDRMEITYVIISLLSLVMLVPSFVMRIGRHVDLLDYIYIFVCVFAMWFLVFRLQKYKLESKIRREDFEAYKEVIAQIRVRQHKIKNHIDAAYRMYDVYDNYDELVSKQKEYLNKVEEYELPNDAIVLEEPTIIALIYEKINEAMDHGIRVSTSFSSSMIDSRLSDLMWVEIIGTLFDNAIEAVDTLDGNKKIWLEIYSKDGRKLSLKMANTFPSLTKGQIDQFFRMGYSTKGEERGLGLYNINDMIYKNKGTLQASSDDYEQEPVIIFEITI